MALRGKDASIPGILPDARSTDKPPAASMGAMFWLPFYIVINLSVTILNKSIFSTYNWPHPTILALWHYTVTSFGTLMIVRVLRIVPAAKLEWGTVGKLGIFSVLFNVNIWLSNVTLNMVSMAMHQVIRALIPACTVVFSYLILKKTYSKNILFSLVIIFVGVLTYAVKGEVDYSLFGLFLTFVGCMTAALKGVLTNLFMVGDLKLHPLDLVTYTSTFSAIQLFVIVSFTGELTEALGKLGFGEGAIIRSAYLTNELLAEQSEAAIEGVTIPTEEGETHLLIRLLILNGVGAFFLNVASFSANKATSPLVMNIGGIVKQILSIILAIIVFHTPVTMMTCLGVGITMLGIVYYSRESFKQKQISAEAARSNLPGQV